MNTISKINNYPLIFFTKKNIVVLEADIQIFMTSKIVLEL